MPDLSFLQWATLGLAAVVVGFAKTGVAGAGMLAVALCALVLPARASTGTLFVLMFLGDPLAIWFYRRTVAWGVLRRLVGPVVLGLLVGGIFLAYADDTVMRRAIGVLLLAVLALQWWTGRRGEVPAGRGTRFYASLAAATALAANSGGPAMAIAMLRERLDKWTFLGTLGWFFFLLNIVKLPVVVALGVLTPAGTVTALLLLPGVVAGALLGRWLVARMDQRVFRLLITAFVVLGAVQLALT